MIKKLLLLALPVAAIAVLSFQVASADYYDCQGNLREGSPGPSECRQLRDVEESSSTNTGVNTTPTTPTTVTGINTLPMVTQMCGDRPCSIVDTQTTTDDDDFDIRNVRKYCVREYCYLIYEVCRSNGQCKEYSKRVPREDYEDYNNNTNNDYDDWRERLNNYTYNYIYNRYNIYNFYNSDRFNDCKFYENGCAYRGTYYGRYHNRYWDF